MVEGHTKGTFHYHPRKDKDYDYLFVLCGNGEQYLIPANVLPRTKAALNAYQEYIVEYGSVV